MAGSQGMATSSPKRRCPMRARGFFSLLAVAAAVSAQPVRITLDEAIQMALHRNHTLLAARTNIQESQAQEITANLRPNPTIFTDWEYLPLYKPPEGTSFLQYLHDSTEADLGLSYLFDRGQK